MLCFQSWEDQTAGRGLNIMLLCVSILCNAMHIIFFDILWTITLNVGCLSATNMASECSIGNAINRIAFNVEIGYSYT